MVNPKLRDEQNDQLCRAVLTLNSVDECYQFFEDICTIKEMQDLMQRLQVALMLSKGMNYQEISSQTSVSSATISRVNRCLNYGEGGYGIVLERMGKNE